MKCFKRPAGTRNQCLSPGPDVAQSCIVDHPRGKGTVDCQRRRNRERRPVTATNASRKLLSHQSLSPQRASWRHFLPQSNCVSQTQARRTSLAMLARTEDAETFYPLKLRPSGAARSVPRCGSILSGVDLQARTLRLQKQEDMRPVPVRFREL